MRRVSLILLVLAIGVAFFLWFDGPHEYAPSAAPGSPGPERPSTGVTQSGEVDNDATHRESIESTQPDEPGSEPPVAKNPRTLLIGRCVAAETGRPIRGCRVRAAQVAAEAVSGRDGRFELDLTGETLGFFAVLIDGPGRFRMENHLTVPAGTTMDVGDVHMATGTTLNGRVTDRAGLPVAAAQVVLFDGRNTRTSAGWSRANWIEFVTGGDGSFGASVSIPSGNYVIAVRTHSLDRPKRLVVEPEMDYCSVNITVDRRLESELISGRVTDVDGRALTGIHLQIAAATNETAQKKEGLSRVLLNTIVTDASGMFQVLWDSRFWHPDADPGAGAWISARSSPKYLPQAGGSLVPWGTTDMVIRLRPRDPDLIDVVLVVRSAIGDVPVERYSIQCMPSPFSSQALTRIWKAADSSSRHAKGRYEMRGLDDGRYVIAILPKDVEKWHRAGAMIELPRDRGHELRIALRKMVPITVTVVDANDNPMHDSTVNLMETAPGDGRKQAAGFPRFVSYAKTDATGIAQLRGPLGNSNLEFQVSGPAHLPASLTWAHLSEDNAMVRVVVSRGATLHGQVRPMAVWKSLLPKADAPKVSTYLSKMPKFLVSDAQMGRNGRKRPFWRNVTPGRDGAFQIAGMPPGRYRLTLSFYGLATYDTGTVTYPFRSSFYVPNVLSIGSRGEHRADIDLASMRLLDLRGRVWVDGKRRPRAPIMLYRIVVGANGKSGPRSASSLFVVDANGEFIARGIPAGEYYAHSPGAGDSQRVRVEPGQNVRHDFRIVTSSLELRMVIAATGAPIVGQRFRTNVGAKTSDRDGVLRWRPAPRSVVVMATVAGKAKRFGPFKPRRGESMTKLTVRVD